MNREKLNALISGQEAWGDDLGHSWEYRGEKGFSWYDLSLNCNTIPCDVDTAIIVTSWYGHLKFLMRTLEQYRKTGAFVILAYNNPFYGMSSAEDMTCWMPDWRHFLMANAFVMKHITYDCEKRNGWFWNTRYAQAIVKSFPNIKYVLSTNGDCLIEKPEGLKDVKALLGDADLMSGQQSISNIHTASVLYKAEAFHKIMDWMYEVMRRYVISSFCPETLLMDAITDLKLNAKPAPKQPIYPQDGTIDMYTCYGQDSTWKDLLGYRNLFAEQECAWVEGLDPVPAKFVDNYRNWIYFEGCQRESLCKFYETGDRRYLMMWWDKGETSWYDRISMPVEFYGEKPIC
jgi:hypothetical protein